MRSEKAQLGAGLTPTEYQARQILHTVSAVSTGASLLTLASHSVCSFGLERGVGSPMNSRYLGLEDPSSPRMPLAVDGSNATRRSTHQVRFAAPHPGSAARPDSIERPLCRPHGDRLAPQPPGRFGDGMCRARAGRASALRLTTPLAPSQGPCSWSRTPDLAWFRVWDYLGGRDPLTSGKRSACL